MFRPLTALLGVSIAASALVAQDAPPSDASQVREPDSGISFPRELVNKDLGITTPQKLVALGVNEGLLGRNRYAVGVYLEDAKGALAGPLTDTRPTKEKDREAFRNALAHSPSPKTFRLVMTKEMNGEDLAKDLREDLKKRLEITGRLPEAKDAGPADAAAGKQDPEMLARDFTKPLEGQKLVRGDDVIITVKDKGKVSVAVKGRQAGQQLTSPHLVAGLVETFLGSGKDPIVDLKSIAEVTREDREKAPADAGYREKTATAPAGREPKPPKNP